MPKQTFITNAGALATRKRILAGQTEERFRVEANRHAERMRMMAVVWSSGTIKTAQLRRMGGVYATRLPANSAPTPDYVVNAQSGEFRSAWKCRATKTRSGWTVSLWNDDPKAKFMLGTDRMRPRPILDEIQRRTAPLLPAAVAGVMTQAVRRNGGSAPVGSGGGGTALGGLLYAVGVGVTSAAGAVEGAL